MAGEGGDELVPGRVVTAFQALRFRALQCAFALALLLQLDKGSPQRNLLHPQARKLRDKALPAFSRRHFGR
jgi:hypothetical protein